jgi:hypothetical protein
MARKSLIDMIESIEGEIFEKDKWAALNPELVDDDFRLALYYLRLKRVALKEQVSVSRSVNGAGLASVAHDSVGLLVI